MNQKLLNFCIMTILLNLGGIVYREGNVGAAIFNFGLATVVAISSLWIKSDHDDD